MAVTYTIHAGTHRGRPLHFGLWWNKKHLSYEVTFHNDCIYDLPGSDMMDTNKLFGIGYFPHHKNSARFGWRYDRSLNKIVLSAYCYDAGKRTIQEICTVGFGEPVRCDLQIGIKGYFFDVSTRDLLGQAVMQKSHTKRLSFPLGIYFGGNKEAPRTMTIQMKKA